MHIILKEICDRSCRENQPPFQKIMAPFCNTADQLERTSKLWIFCRHINRNMNKVGMLYPWAPLNNTTPTTGVLTSHDALGTVWMIHILDPGVTPLTLTVLIPCQHSPPVSRCAHGNLYLYDWTARECRPQFSSSCRFGGNARGDPEKERQKWAGTKSWGSTERERGDCFERRVL